MDDPATSGRNRSEIVDGDPGCRSPATPQPRPPRDAVEEALVRAILDHARDLGRIALKVVGDIDAAEEAVAEAYFRAWRDRRAIRRDPFAWLKRTVFRVALDLRRAAAARVTVPLDEALLVPSPAPGPEALEMIREERRLVRAAVSRLPAPYREAVRLRELDEWKTAPAAAALGVTVSTLKFRVQRGKVLLAPLLEGILRR